MASLSRTQRRKWLRQKAQHEQAVQQRYAQPAEIAFEKLPLVVEVLPDRHRKNYDAHGNFIYRPRPCELEAQRQALAGQTR